MAVLKNHTFHDEAVAIDNGTDLSINSNISSGSILLIDITGTATTRTIDFYGKSINNNFILIKGYNMSTSAMASQTTGITDELWQFDITGLIGFRCDLSAVSGGNVTVNGRLVI